jgi:hypothetical protein
VEHIGEAYGIHVKWIFRLVARLLRMSREDRGATRLGSKGAAAIGAKAFVTSAPIIVLIDGTDLGCLALRQAGSVAQESSRRVVVVFVRQFRLSGMTHAFVPDGIAIVEDALDAARTVALAQAISELDPRLVDWSFEVHEGEPMEHLMAAARSHGSDTIVIARPTTGMFRMDRRLSLVARMTRKWTGTLVVVRDDNVRGSSGDQSDIS